MSESRVGTRPLRVALLHNIVSPHVVPLFAELARQPGIDLRVYFFSETDENRRWQANPAGLFQYRILPHLGVRLRGRDLFTYFINPTIVPVLLRDDFDVLISVGWDSFASQAAFFLCKLLHRPFIIWSGSTMNEPSWRRTISLPLVRMMVRGADACIAYGTRAREYLQHLGAHPTDIFLSLNTIDIDGFATRVERARSRTAVVRQELGLGSGPVILYVGQLIERKGVATLLDAVAEIRERLASVRLLIVGYGQQEVALRQRAAELDLTEIVHFLGHVDLDSLPHYYAVADVFVLPSWEEVWGLVLNEAIAAGLPLVTTDRVGAAPDVIVPNENGYVVPAGDGHRLAQALAAILGDSELADRMSARSRELRETLRVVHTVKGVVAAIERAKERTATWRRVLSSISGGGLTSSMNRFRIGVGRVKSASRSRRPKARSFSTESQRWMSNVYPYARFLSQLPAAALPALTSLPITSRLVPLVRVYLRLFGFPDLGGHMRYPQVMARLQPELGQVLLDAGCGTGMYGLALSCEGGMRVYAVDLDEERINRLKSVEHMLPCAINFSVMSLTDLDFADQSFDRILCVEVLEHVPDDRRAVVELARVARPGARLVLSVPTSDRLISKEERRSFDAPKDLAHVRSGYRAGNLRDLLENAGWRVHHVEPVFSFWEDRVYRGQRWLYLHNYPLLNVLTFPLLRAATVGLRRLPPQQWHRGWMVTADRYH